jgi:hypothetical protein
MTTNTADWEASMNLITQSNTLTLSKDAITLKAERTAALLQHMKKDVAALLELIDLVTSYRNPLTKIRTFLH